MIHLRNGHTLDFVVASGALGYDGDGWWFEKPWIWFGILDPSAFTIITKTLTYRPRRGNLRWWCPWRCVRPIKRGWVNAVGLTNPGYRWWMDEVYPRLRYRTIVSIAPDTFDEAERMAKDLSGLNLVALELNVSCPNTDQDKSFEFVYAMTQKVVEHSHHPVILKLSIDQPYERICVATDGLVDAVDLINSVKWKRYRRYEHSPLERYGLMGAVSGRCIRVHAESALITMQSARVAHKFKTPIISGGGISSYNDCVERQRLGADAFSFGTVFITKPWLPNWIAARWRRNHPVRTT